jgi:hypothetical protein
MLRRNNDLVMLLVDGFGEYLCHVEVGTSGEFFRLPPGRMPYQTFTDNSGRLVLSNGQRSHTRDIANVLPGQPGRRVHLKTGESVATVGLVCGSPASALWTYHSQVSFIL